MPNRLTFLSHFCISLAIAAGAFFAWRAGIPQLVIANNVARWFGGAIGALFVWTAIWLGRQAWRVDTPEHYEGDAGWHRGTLPSARLIPVPHVDASFGHLVELVFPAIGMLGTVAGLSLAFKDAGSPEMLRGAATAFYSTGCGITAMILTMFLTASLEAGIRRARQ